MKLAILQIQVTDNKQDNLNKVEGMIREAARNGSEMIILPEMFNCPYDNRYFPLFAESGYQEETGSLLAKLARDLKIWIIGGSIPERDGEDIYNTSFVFDSQGNMVARHRKLHLYDVSLANGFTFRESEILKPGNELTIFDSPWGRIGVIICYDIRFPEPARLLALRGARMIAVPAAFNMTTGPAHWEPQMRIRALDNQLFVVAASPARDTEASYQAYGHSMAVSPWGEVIAHAGHEEEVLVADLNMDQVDKIREEFPLLKHRRTDLYEVIDK